MMPDVDSKWAETVEGKMVIAKYTAGRRAFEKSVFVAGVACGMVIATLLLFFVDSWVIPVLAFALLGLVFYFANRADTLYHDAMQVVEAEAYVTPPGDTK